MKRQYQTPHVKVVKINIKAHLLTISSPKGIGYGGLDTSGRRDPASRKMADWDSDWDPDWDSDE